MFSPFTRVFASNTRRACFAVVLLASAARAATISWDGDTDTTFLNANNWVGGVAPASSVTTDIAQFGTTLTTFQPTLTADRFINGLIFQSTTGGWTLGGTSTLTIGSGGINDTANTSGTTTINANLVISPSQNWSSGNGGRLLVNGLVGITGGNRTLTVDSGTVTIQNGFRNGANPRVLTKAGLGTLELNGPAGTELGGFLASGGTTILGHASALGTGMLTMSGGMVQASIDLSGANAITNVVSLTGLTGGFTGSNDITLAGKLLVNSGSGRPLNNTLDSGKTLLVTGTVYTSTSPTVGGTLTIAGTGNTTFSGVIADFETTGVTGNVIVTNTGVTTFTGTNIYSGNTTVNAGRLILAGDNSGVPGVVTIGNGGTVQAGSLANFSAGALQFNTGGTANKATLALRSDGSTSIAKNASGNGVQAIVGTAEFNVDRATPGGPAGGIITWGNGGTMTMNNDNGQILVTGGNGYGLTLNQSLTWAGNNQTNKPNIVNNAPGLLTIQGGITGANVNSRSLEFSGTGDIRVNGTITGTSFYVNKTGNGTLTLANAVTPTSGSPAYRYLVQSGTLKLAVTAALENDNTANWTATRIAVASGATLAFNVGGTNEFTTGHVTTLLTNLAASTTAVTTSGAAANGMNAGSNFGFDTTNASGGTFTIADTIADTTGAAGGARGLTKLGTNTLTLTGSNTYSGGTTVTSGRLEVNNTSGSGTGSGTVTVNAGAFLAGEGSITTGSNNYVYINGTLQAGSTAATQGTDFSLSTSGMGGTVFGATSTAHFDLWSTTGTDQSSLLAAADMLRIFGDLTLTTGSTLKLGNPNNLTFQEGDVFRLFDWTGVTTRTGTFSTIDSADLNLGSLNLDTSNLYTTGTISILGIPEPGRALLLILGLTGVTMRRRRVLVGS
jgi:autotransporter-associated beta strand protein